MKVINPKNGELVAEIADDSENSVASAYARARRAQPPSALARRDRQ